jgi:ceramide glucosyltransferase
VILRDIFGGLALLSLALSLWQWLGARRFPLHRWIAGNGFAPAVTLLKPLKGHDGATEACLRSWLAQDYPGDIQVLFGVASAGDPVCELVRKLLREFASRDAQLIISGPPRGTNAKVSTLSTLVPLAKHDLLIISDADVRAPADLLLNVVAPLQDPGVGLVNCFYRLAKPVTLAMRWEAVAINADFWSQVLQARSLKPLDFALGAVMAIPKKQLQAIGGFESLLDYLADDYLLGHRIARNGSRIELCPVVVDCWEPRMGWRAVWKRQLRWARTIRISKPAPYFFSALSNGTLWAVIWLVLVGPPFSLLLSSHVNRTAESFGNITTGSFAFSFTFRWSPLLALGCLFARMLIAADLQHRLTRSWSHLPYLWLVPIRDSLQAAIWLLAFTGRRVEWRGGRFRLQRDGTLVKDRG